MPVLRPSGLFSLLACSLLTLVFVGPAAGQQSASFGWAPADTLRADFEGPPVRTQRTVPAPRRSAARATFEVEYVEPFPAEARAAFQLAVDIWSERVESSVPIRIRARWEEADEADILGTASPRVIANFSGSPQANTWYASALADALAGQDVDSSEPDISASFNSTFPSWYFGLDANPPAGEFDLTTVVLHELGHGLGFIGSMTVEAEVGSWGIGSQGYPVIYDRFAERGDGTPLLSLSNFSASLAGALTSGAVFFDGPTARAQGASLPEIYAPAAWQPGSSFSHLDEQTYAPGTLNALMTPRFSRGEAVHDPGPITCGALRDMGWMLGAACEAIAFSAGVDGRDVVLTFFLPGDAGFVSGVVEREEEGVFEPVDVTVPALDPEAAGTYTVRVSALAPGSYTFRLRLQRTDGTEFVIDAAPVQVFGEANALDVFPNPVIGQATVRVGVREVQTVSVRVYDARGRLVATLLDKVPGPATATLNGSGLAAGVYFVRVEGEAFSETRAVTILR